MSDDKSDVDDKGVSQRSEKGGQGTEAERIGGKAPASRQAERDSEDSAKESGE